MDLFLEKVSPCLCHEEDKLRVPHYATFPEAKRLAPRSVRPENRGAHKLVGSGVAFTRGQQEEFITEVM
jgi:hypothetical protein